MMGYYKLPVEEQSIDERGWLHTGDLGFVDSEGYIHLSGRLKELIIRGGENIMPGAVESAVSALNGIESVKVIGVPSEFYGEEVCACIKLKDGAEFDNSNYLIVITGKKDKDKTDYYLQYNQELFWRINNYIYFLYLIFITLSSPKEVKEQSEIIE